jgi:hypothetical protein
LPSFLGGLSSLLVVIVILITIIRKGIVSGFIAGVVTGTIVSSIALQIAPVALFLVIGTAASSVALTVAIVSITAALTSVFCNITGILGGIVGIIIANSLILSGLIDAFQAQYFPGMMAATIPGTVVLVGGYRGWYGFYIKRNIWIYSFSVAFAAVGGTSFSRATLTDADFTGATLKNTNFNQAILTRTCFKDTVKLNLARPGNTLLANPKVRDLLIKPSSGEGQDYSKANLRGANLKEANLQRANLTQADISEASFLYANLSDANLTEVNAVKTDFILETLAKGLEPATKLATACKTILPQIITFLGISL